MLNVRQPKFLGGWRVCFLRVTLCGLFEMKKCASLLALFLIARVNNPAVAADTCALKQLASFDLTVTPAGYLSIPVLVGGIHHTFIIEPQAMLSAIPKRSIAALSAKIDSSNKQNIATLSNVEMGNIHASEMQIRFIDDAQMREASADGVIGRDFLQQFDLEVDLKSDKMVLFSPDHCDHKVVYWAPTFAAMPIDYKLYGPVVRFQLDGETVLADISFEPRETYMRESAARDIFGISLSGPDVRPAGQGVYGRPVFTYPFKSLSVDGLAITNPNIKIFSEGDTPCDGREHNGKRCVASELSLGLSELRKLHLYFAYHEKMLYVTAADAHR